ncbi:TolC family protein [Vibrio rumoiensis]|uniref:Copper transporter n=1 Tax=Vibrio rumoiensis 1S-45 TaxID=1188252 RepID=A0A1E5E1S1_9VIBR|nr:TolC family protein [Vibrio rumoiensis]OEF24289.1 copper transporter [Vibrio rumoiensis 1S-45]
MTFKPWTLYALVAGFCTPVWAQSQLTGVIEQALELDAGRQQILAQSQAIRENGIASATQADPKIKFGVGGMPIDSWTFDSDPMTNISIGLMQEFGRGSSLDLQAEMANKQADGNEWQIKIRELTIANTVTQLWSELIYQQQAATIIRDNQKLVKELVTFIDTNYSMGRSESQDALQARVQLEKLNDQLQQNQQTQQRIFAQLSEWLGANWLTKQNSSNTLATLNWESLDQMLASKANQNTQFYDLLMAHPSVQMAETSIAANQVQVKIANESYKPKFGVEVMYGYRQANGMNGQPASDLVSAYLTMDLPLFTDKRQDRQYAAAQYQVGAARSQRDVLLQQLNAKANALMVDRINLTQRLERYQDRLLPQAKSRTQAVERGYQSNTAQFNDVVASIRDELSLKLELKRLQADLNITNSNLAYLFNGFDYQIDAPTLPAEQE